MKCTSLLKSLANFAVRLIDARRAYFTSVPGHPGCRFREKKKIGVTAKESKGASSIVRPEYRYRTHSRGQELEQTGVNVFARNKKKKCYFPFMCCILGSKLRKFCIGHFDPSLFQFFTPTASGCNSVLGLGGR